MTRTTLALLTLCLPSLLSAADELPKADSPRKVPPGATALLTSSVKKMTYFLRVPRTYHPKRGARLVVFLHGSNMNGLSYLRSFESRKWATDAILVCPNGETGAGPYKGNNFTFGSAPFVADVTKEVQEAFKVTRTYVGGHSQGGFLTYSVILHYPDLYDGAIPMAGDCWMQNEPNLWEDKPEMLAKQKRIAIAVIHGKKDPVVRFSQGEHAYGVFEAMGYPKLRFFAPERLGHQFMLSPVGEALDWLDAMTGLNPKKSGQLTGKWAQEGEWGWAVQGAQAIQSQKRVPSSSRGVAKKVLRAAEVAAKKELKAMAESMASEPPLQWIPRWFEFRQKFGATKAAAPLVQRYEELRNEQRAVAEGLIDKAWGLYRGDRDEEAKDVMREILEKAPATYQAHYAVRQLKKE